MKLTTKATELIDTEVQAVSLVKKGAIRVPFRIVKEDTSDMIDLSKIAATAFNKSATALPTVYAAVVAKGEGFSLEAATKAITDAGLKVDNIEETDTAVFFKQDAKAPASVQTMKINDNFGLLVAGVQKSFESYDFQSTTFKELFATEGFFPSMWMGADMLAYTIGNIMQKAENPGDAFTMISSAVDEFKTWMGDLAKAIPEHAFKADIALHKAEVNAGEDGATPVVTEPATPAPVEEPEADDEAEGTEEEGDDADTPDEPEAVEKADKKKVKGKGNLTITKKDKSTEPEAPAPDGNAALLKSIGELIDGKIAPVTKSLTDVTKRLDGVDGKLKKAEEAINGTVSADADGDHDEPERTQKSESKVPPLLDTGMGRVA